MNKKTIGIVGQGFVGTAVREGLSNFYNIETYDKFKTSTRDSLEELVGCCDFIFLCLPTPMRRTGECDLDIVKDTVLQIDSMKKEKILILKSTVPPGTTEILNRECKYVNIVFNPEFLTEANFLDDFKNQNRIIVGGERPYSTKVSNLFKKVFPKTPIVKTGSTTAEMVKYFTNCFLATKVAFANEIKQYCDKLKIDYDKVVEYVLYDDRIGRTHLSVPGPDGNLGFGGSCFPKDINALIHELEKNQISPKVLKSAWNKNLEVRPQKDWENLKGRAVSEEQGE
tara:strand:- start:104 stop:952 length:849 start_codon:yes stop_codon:yes gene_type:complete